ncbi:MAG: hypothetical protein JW776_09720 [Candidatus Lokiarchaeota archaeon]|nr:hypothetical protein [Candidatus Lokiarchaeota archaeon]
MHTIDSLSSFLENQTQKNAKYAFLLDTGLIIKSTISEENLMQLVKFIPRICKEVKPGTYLHKSKLYIYRLTSQFIIFLLTNKEHQDVDAILEEVADRYSLKISREFNLQSQGTIGHIIKTIVFSVTTERGPELMDWMVNDHAVGDKDAYKIAMKTMLNLTDEIEGAKNRVLFFQPFLSYNSLGISYLFQIPYPGARGGAFDSAITILVDFQHRPIIYSSYKELEDILQKFEPLIAKKFQETYIEDACVKSDDFNGILIDLHNRINTIQMKMVDSEILMDEMLDAIRALNEL